jgi:prolyl 4-hydroxylase
VKIIQGCARPYIYEDFLNEEECAALIEAANERGLARSNVLDKGNSISSSRTSSQIFLEKSHPASRPFVDKVKELTGISEDKFEDIQILRYNVGEKYDAHYDSCHRCKSDGTDLLRVQTCLTYLNDCEEGGETYFPTADITVSPKQGSMVRWYNISDTNQILPCSFHQAKPVKHGVKWAATIWINR